VSRAIVILAVLAIIGAWVIGGRPADYESPRCGKYIWNMPPEWAYLGRIAASSIIGNNTPSDFQKVVKASTVDNCVAATDALTCTTNQTFSIVDCGASTTCASPTVICSVQVTAAGTAFLVASPASPTIAAGDYIAAESTAGSCTTLSTAGITAQIHSN